MQFQPPRLNKKLALVLVFIALALLTGHVLELYLPDLEVWIENMGVWGPLGFILLFAILAPVFVSVDALCFAAGLLFPVVTGELTVIIATYLSAAIMFYLGRDLFRERVLTLIGEHKRFSSLEKIISGDNAFKLMFLLRVTPLPFAMLNYALSVTNVKFRPYLAATTGILMYNGTLVYLGNTTRHLTGLLEEPARNNDVSYPILAVGLFILIAVLSTAAKIARDTLKELHVENTDL